MIRQEMVSVEIDMAQIESEMIDYVSRHSRPEDVFDMEELREWATSHGYVKEIEEQKKEEPHP